MKYKNLDQLFRQMARKLSFSACPFIEARLFIQKAAGWDEIEFFHQLDQPVPPGVLAKLDRLVRMRQAGWPVAYILGKKEFWSLEFRVNRWVLIPRPETELVVEKALGLPLPESPQILDVGTGCGNLAISLAKEIPVARVTASDISRRALQIASWNAKNLGVKNVKFVHTDGLEYFISRKKRFHLIVSNPPYVSENEWQKLDRPVRDFEPRKALVAGPTGVEFIQRLIREAFECLTPGGFLVFEFGAGQEEKILKHFQEGWQEAAVHLDYSGRPRVITARKAG